jgi:phosphoribosylamine--glycine ligase
LTPAQDHKRIYDADQGPNTGGMGAYSPAPVVTDTVSAQIMTEIIAPTVQGMAARGTPYRGVLYVGVMIVEERPYVVEFNARFGDPETQVLLVRLADDLLPLLDGAARGQLRGLRADVVSDAAVCVVMATEGYPGAYAQGLPIAGLENVAASADTWVFHAGTAVRDRRIVTSGGRVLGVTARAPTIALAVQQAYKAAAQIQWPGAYYRRDIAFRALQRASL